MLARHGGERGEIDARGKRRVEEDVRDQDARQAIKPTAGVDADETQPLPQPAGAAEHFHDGENDDDRRENAGEVERRDEDAAAGERRSPRQRERERSTEAERERGGDHRLQQREADDAADITPRQVRRLLSGGEEQPYERRRHDAEDKRQCCEAGKELHLGVTAQVGPSPRRERKSFNGRCSTHLLIAPSHSSTQARRFASTSSGAA